MSTLDGTIVLISYPALSATFGLDAAIVAWVGIAYFLTSTSLLMTMGALGDFWGRERVYLIGLVAFTFPLALIPFSTSVYQVIVWRAVQGIGSAMVLSASMAIIAAVFPRDQRGIAFGLTGAIVGIGLGSGPPLGGIILDLVDWRALFYSRFPLGLIAVLLGWGFLKRGPRVEGRLQLDVLGSVLLLVALGGLLLAINQAGRLGPISPLVLGAAAVTIVSLPWLVLQEKRAARPIIDLKMFRNPLYSGGVIALLGLFQSWNAVGFLLPFVMINGLGYSGAKAGLVLSVFSLVRSLASPIAGWLGNRLSHRLLMGAGMGLMAACLLVLSRMGLDTGVWEISLVLAFASTGSALFDPVNAASMMSTVPQERLGMAAATIATARQIGLSAGIALSGAILAARQVHHLESLAGQASSLDVEAIALVRGTGDALVVSAVICLITIVPLVLWRRRSGPPGSAERD